MKATFAGGCFWCMEAAFHKKGVEQVVSGYTGGDKKDPSYEEVSTGRTGHVEAVQVIYNPDEITYKALLDIFWQSIDPTDDSGQFADRGSQYKSAVFFHCESQKKEAEKSKKDLQKHFDKPITTPILPAKEFYPAEEYHQNYHRKNPVRYKTYSVMSGREGFLKKIWRK